MIFGCVGRWFMLIIIWIVWMIVCVGWWYWCLLCLFGKFLCVIMLFDWFCCLMRVWWLRLRFWRWWLMCIRRWLVMVCFFLLLRWVIRLFIFMVGWVLIWWIWSVCLDWVIWSWFSMSCCWRSRCICLRIMWLIFMNKMFGECRKVFMMSGCSVVMKFWSVCCQGDIISRKL